MNIPNDALIIWAMKNKALLPPLLPPAILGINLEHFGGSGVVGNAQEFFEMFYDCVHFFFPDFSLADTIHQILSKLANIVLLNKNWFGVDFLFGCLVCSGFLLFWVLLAFFFANKTSLSCAKGLNQDRGVVN